MVVSQFLTATGFACLLATGMFLYRAGGEIRALSRAKRPETEPIDSLVPGDSAAVDGTAVQCTEAVTAVFSAKECLVCGYEVREHRDAETGEQERDGWTILAEGEESVGFVVEDETGRAYVDPRGASLRLSEEYISSYPWQSLPDRVESFVAETDAIEQRDRVFTPVASWLVTDERQFVEKRLAAGESVHVAGTVGPPDERVPADADIDVVLGAPELLIGHPAEWEQSWLTDESTKRYLAGALLTLMLGLLFVFIL